MAYTLEITDGSTTYTFGTSKMPKFKPRFDYEYNEEVTPPVQIAEIATWTLEGAFYTGTDSQVTGDVTTLQGLLGERLSPVTTVTFKRDGSAVFTLSTSTHKGGLMVRSFDPAEGGDGQWATHWRGTIVIVGKRLLDDGTGVVKATKEYEIKYGPNGLSVVRQTGTVTTVPGTSAEEKARERGLESPGDNFGLQTAGPDDEPSVTILDLDTDTVARFETVWKEFAIALPAGCNDYDLVEETVDDPDAGETVTISVRAVSPTRSAARNAVLAKRPGSQYAGGTIVGDEAQLEWRGQFTKKRPSATTQALLQSDKIVYRRVEFSIRGRNEDKDRDRKVHLIPGFDPVFTAMPRGAKVLTEKVVVAIRGSWSALTDFGIAPRAAALPGAMIQPGETAIEGPRLEERGATPDADRWRVEATYSYLAASIDPARVAELAKKQ